MKVFILTCEPYHDNSQIEGVYLDEYEAIDALKASVDPSNINCPDSWLTEWDTSVNQEGRRWKMTGTQANDPSRKGWNPIRKDFVLEEL